MGVVDDIKDGIGSKVKVKLGDTIDSIASSFNVDPQQLMAANNLVSPEALIVGQELYVNPQAVPAAPIVVASAGVPVNVKMGLSAVKGANELVATWDWCKEHDTAKYKLLWTYDNGNNFRIGDITEKSVDKDYPYVSRYATFSVPTGAKYVWFKVKAVAETHEVQNGNGTVQVENWKSDWSKEVSWTNQEPLEKPSTPNFECDQYGKGTISLDGLSESKATHIEYELLQDNVKSMWKTSVKITNGSATHVTKLQSGNHTYKVRARAKKGSQVSDWSEYTSNDVRPLPIAPVIYSCKATSKNSITVKWASPEGGGLGATGIEIEYALKKSYFDYTDKAASISISDMSINKREISGIEEGGEYFFRARSTNATGSSGWSDIVSTFVGAKPDPPTTWSSSSTVISGEPIMLFWVHNSRDNSSWTKAKLEVLLYGKNSKGEDIVALLDTPILQNENLDNDELKDQTSSYSIDSSIIAEHTNFTELKWRISTAGANRDLFSDWSVQRSIKVYEQPSIDFQITDSEGQSIDTVTSLPIHISGETSPHTQTPLSYSVVVTSNESYETTDVIGNPMYVSANDPVYSKYFDSQSPLSLTISADSIDLNNGIEYTITVTAAMSSGLTATSSSTFTVDWQDIYYEPDAEIRINEDNMSVYIRPYCETTTINNYLAMVWGDQYSNSGIQTGPTYAFGPSIGQTRDGYPVYRGVDSTGLVEQSGGYYCVVERRNLVPDVKLSVHRREYDGSYTEIATNLTNNGAVTVVDPHPALDYARYRIVATHEQTGAVSYRDMASYPILCADAIIQWDEEWTSFEVSEDGSPERPPWTGSLLKLSYNIDVSNTTNKDVSIVEYVGRKHPVVYYGTQRGEAQSWNMDIPKSDKETLYALRRLQNWMGAVYVREPSGTGYWANINVSFSQKHKDVTIPISIDITRVEGGM